MGFAAAARHVPHQLCPHSVQAYQMVAVRVGKYELGKTLGKGTYGKVKLATEVPSGKQFAVKVKSCQR